MIGMCFLIWKNKACSTNSLIVLFLGSAAAAVIKLYAFLLERDPVHVLLMPFAIPVILFMSEHDGFSPHGTVFSPTARGSLQLSEDGDMFGCSPAV